MICARSVRYSFEPNMILRCQESFGRPCWKINKLQKLEDALVKQMLTGADRADQAERDGRTDLAEVAEWTDRADGDDRADQG